MRQALAVSLCKYRACRLHMDVHQMLVDTNSGDFYKCVPKDRSCDGSSKFSNGRSNTDTETSNIIYLLQIKFFRAY